MKTVVIGTIIFISGILLGMVLFRYNLFPVRELKKLKSYIFQYSIQTQLPDNVYLSPYTSGTPLFSDRAYNDTIGERGLDSTYVLQIPRHLKTPIEIEVHRPVIIYRLLTEKNDNSVFAEWELTDMKVMVEGRSCTYNTVVSKYFESGKLRLLSGGPTAASPIIIKDLTHTPVSLPIRMLNMKTK